MANEHTRRSVLRTACIAAAAAVIAPRMANATPGDVAAEIRKLFGDKAPASGRIKLDVPQIAENGLAVPINIEVESPMTAADYVKSVHVFAEGNPAPGVVSYRFTPECGKASASTRMRLAQSQNIVVIAEMSGGQIFSVRQDITVTVGGCGG
ncbi:MAG: thiosulfate oxidation carrier protein SoxY [Beijerinckiaceae bacterium]|nr:thiosulfate oxidation carrier protein SoxY [Beijerinckiaceae bacterium]